LLTNWQGVNSSCSFGREFTNLWKQAKGMLRKNHEAPSPPQTPAKVNWTWEIVSAENPNTDVLQRFHSSIIERFLFA
jgi:hypothetical protein